MDGQIGWLGNRALYNPIQDKGLQEEAEMSKVSDFIKECGSFFVLTLNGDCPAGRPFGAIMEIKEDLYISTDDRKAVYRQLKANANVQLLALKPGTREWVRVTGAATECDSVVIKAQMLEECPVLKGHYSSADEPHYRIFKVKVFEAAFQ